MKVEIIASTAERLAEAMNIKKYKQADLVRLTGIDKSSISLYLKGKYSPKGIKLVKLANALNVSPSWLSGFNVPINSDINTTNPSLYNKPSTIIRNRRTELGLTVEELAKAVGVNESKIKNLENGYITDIKPNELTKLAKVLEIDPTLLLEVENNLSPKVADSSDRFKIHTDDEKLLLNNYNALNQTGKEKLIDYSDDLVSNGKYKQQE